MIRRRRRSRATPTVRFSNEEARALQAYLYGHVPKNEIEAAVYWEHGRLSKSLCDVAEQFKKCSTQRDFAQLQSLTYDTGWWQWPWPAFWESPSFPAKPWLALEASEKEPILQILPIRYTATMPLPVPDVRILPLEKVFDTWKQAARDPANRKKKIGLLPARYTRNGECEYVLFTINYWEGKTKTRARFLEWLNQEHELFEKYTERRTGRDKGLKRWKQALRDVAVRHVAHRTSVERACEWTETAHRRNSQGKAIPFPERKKTKKLVHKALRDAPPPIGTPKQVQEMIRNSKALDRQLFPPQATKEFEEIKVGV
jgi:hypothetical protein